jgi:hypothetical protein
MTQRIFEHWNWRFDYGERPIPETEPLPARYAIAYYDHRNRLYRVVQRVKELADYPDDDPAAFMTYVYDYFCDVNGRVIQKRSLDEQGSVFLIVDFEYDLDRREVTETAWWPADGPCKSLKRPIRTPQNRENQDIQGPEKERGRDS